MTNQGAFAEWTPEEAWLAGLIWADGSLVRGRKAHHSPHVQLGSIDRQMIDEAARILGANVSTYTPAQPRKPFHSVSIHGAPVRRLCGIGLGHDKTYGGGLPDLERLGHAASFVRGVFDGDGSVGLYINPSKVTQEPRLKVNVVGTEQAMTELRDLLVGAAGVRRNKVCAHSRSSVVRQLFLGHADSLRLADFIYSEPGPCLHRKRDIFAAGRALRPLPAVI